MYDNEEEVDLLISCSLTCPDSEARGKTRDSHNLPNVSSAPGIYTANLRRFLGRQILKLFVNNKSMFLIRKETLIL